MRHRLLGPQHGAIVVCLAVVLVQGFPTALVQAAASVDLRSAPSPLPSAQPGVCGAALPFLENRGQVSGEVAFYAQDGGRTVFVTSAGQIVHALTRAGVAGAPDQGWSVREELVGAKAVEVHGGRPAPTTVNYLTGSTPVRLVRGLRTWQSVWLEGPCPGIGVELVARGGEIQKLFHVVPGAQVGDIRVQVAGAARLRATPDGRLELDTGVGPLHFTRPAAYQERDGRRSEIEVAYAVSGDTYGFRVGRYDRRLPLTIDPLLASTYIGGTGQDGYAGIAVARAADGDVLVAGSSVSSGFPTTPGAYDPSHNGNWDLAVVRLDSNLTTLKMATFLGGSGDDGRIKGVCLALGPDGNVYVASESQSTDYPTTAGAYDASSNGARDVVVSRLSAGLDTLLASTYLGGALDDDLIGLTVGSQGDVYISGVTLSTDFPTTVGAYDRTPGADLNVFITRLDPSLSTLVASTYLGGDGAEHPARICLDGSGSLYLAGFTESAGFPFMPGGYDSTLGPQGFSGFVTRMSADLTTLQASTFFHGSSCDMPTSISLGATGDVFLTGHTSSSDMPTTPGAYDRTYNGSPYTESADSFVARFSPDLTTLVASTFLGGAGFEYGMAVQCDKRGSVMVVGRTGSANFPVSAGAYSTALRGTDDVFISRFDEDLTSLEASTFLGGDDYDSGGFSMATDPVGNVYVSGRTHSTDLPTTEGAYDRTYNGNGDWFVCRLDAWLSAVSPVAVEPPGPAEARRLALVAEPNPFWLATRVRFSLDRAAHVRLTVHDVGGRQVAELASGTLSTGPHALAWDGRDGSGRCLAPGAYVVTLRSESRSTSVRVVLVR